MSMMTTELHTQRGLTLGSFIGGLLIGLVVALGVALYVTKAPIPFLDKGAQRTEAQDQAEAAKNKDWNPNAALQSSVPLPQPPARPAEPAPETPPAAPADNRSTQHTNQDPVAIAARAKPQVSAPSAPAAPAPAAPAPTAVAPRPAKPAGTETPAPPTTVSPEPRPANTTVAPNVQFFVQAGAFSSPTEAEQQRGRLALLGTQAAVSRRDQSGTSVYRVRVGPFETREAASIAQRNLTSNGVDAAIVQVQK